MNFELIDFVVFDLFIPERAHADQNYDVDVCDQARIRHYDMSNSAKATLSRTIRAGLPGSTTQLTMDDLR
ncbi:MAG: hypothetical protein ABJD13_17680 [Paracoccaceae bacterium]